MNQDFNHDEAMELVCLNAHDWEDVLTVGKHYKAVFSENGINDYYVYVDKHNGIELEYIHFNAWRFQEVE